MPRTASNPSSAVFPYREAFLAIEQSFVKYGSRTVSPEQIRKELDRYKGYGTRKLTDKLCYKTLVNVVFYSGMRAATVTEKLPVIHDRLGDYRAVADFGPRDIARVLADPKMLRNRRKVEACVKNAAEMRTIIAAHGSFSAYLESFRPRDSFENLLLLKEELEARFAYLGGITVYHFLTELGLPVLKPDRVIARILNRLGLVEFERQHLKTVIHGRKFADATGLPARYIDIVLVAYGQVQTPEFGIDRGICLDKPRCEHCGVTHLCADYQLRRHS